MANIRIKNLTRDASPKQDDIIPIDLAGTRGATVKAVVESGRPTASRTEAEDGTDAYKAMTPLTTKQAIDAHVGAAYVPKTVSVTAGNGLSGGGNLSGNVTVSLSGNINDKINTALQALGGVAGQVLVKRSDSDNDVAWMSNEAATAVSYAPQTLTSAHQTQARINISAQQAGTTLEALRTASGASGNRLPYMTGVNTAAFTTLTSFARTILDDTDGSAMWNTMGGDQSLLSNGWCKLPGGLIIQWGAHWSGGGERLVFPMAFPNACFMVLGSKSQSSMPPNNVYDNWQIASYSRESAFVSGRRITGGSVILANVTGAWVAIGR